MASMRNMGAWLRMLVVETIAKIRRAYFVQKKPIKAICRELGLSRKVVRKVLRSDATEFRYMRETQPLPKIGPWCDALDALLLTNAGKASRERLTLESGLRRALECLGPIFVKFGQVLSTRRDLLPADIADELAKLQDQVPAFSSEQALAEIERSLREFQAGVAIDDRAMLALRFVGVRAAIA